MRKTKILLLALLFILLFSSLALAGTIEERFEITNLLNEVDQMSTAVIAAIRAIAVVFSVLILISIGITFWQCKSGYTLELIKTRIILLFIGFFVIFLTEPIVNFILSIIGW